MAMIDVLVPDEQEGTKAVVRGWLAKIGDRVSVNDPLVELETDKVTQEVPAPADGVLAEILLESDAEAEPGALLARIDPVGEESAASSPAKAGIRGDAATEPRPSPGNGSEKTHKAKVCKEVRLSPAVKRALIQHDLDPANIDGTGRDGRVTLADVDEAVSSATTTRAGAPATAQPRVAQAFDSADIPHDRMRRAIAENMTKAVTDAPHVTALFEADFSAIAAHKAAMKARGVKLSYTAYIVKAAAEAMATVPAINGRWEEGRIAIADSIDIGVGTALGDKGLVVPVVRDCGSRSLEEIGEALGDLTTRARENNLQRSEVTGGSFTISNHGVSGSLLAAPIIIHQGQAAILGVGKLEKRVVVRELDGQDVMVIRPMAYVTLTIDHRVVDGHQTNAWLSDFVSRLENWPAA
ncbi:2-oxo acid dehydrogenase subunit E2 [Sphingomicrobium sp. XHP0235]|uniref:dihydrolipoamide acetyltransferase family protein n=1 Tax=Sphingomicrobium aquimarinum TaxID=3133971 RepID=UPI0031FE7177